MKTLRQETFGQAILRLVERKKDFAGIVILNGKIVDQAEDSDPDRLWQRLCELAGRANPQYFGFDGAKSRFLRIFPRGFESPAYMDHERIYKLSAKTLLDSSAPLDKALNTSGLGEAVLKAYQATNLLSPFEKVRIRDAVRGPHGDDFVRGAARFANGEIGKGLSAMQAALAPHDAAKWTIVTYLPYLWRPDTQMFLKPKVTTDFAARVGHPFAHEYEAAVSEPVYRGLLDLVEQTEQAIADLKPRDRIDLQSFIWTVGEYDVEAERGLD